MVANKVLSKPISAMAAGKDISDLPLLRSNAEKTEGLTLFLSD
jgi:hypothetical protein